jgi:hypothetical protein
LSSYKDFIETNLKYDKTKYPNLNPLKHQDMQGSYFS